MEQLAEIGAKEDDAWAARNEHWLARTTPFREGRSKRERVRTPLILTGHGVRLRIEHGSLYVRDGFTHFPQTPQEFRFFPGDWRTPSRIVLVDGSGGLSFDVLDWLSAQEIELLRINWRGEVISVAGGGGYACDRKIVERQIAAKKNGRALQLARFLIAAKIRGCIETLENALPKSLPVDRAIQRLSADLMQLNEAAHLSLHEILGIEGRAAAAYFGTWYSVPLKWKSTNKHPIPEEWRRIGRRSSAANLKEASKRNATHPVNAILNYVYGVLENQVRIQVLAAGFDPTIGILHGNYREKHGFVLDLMEPLRPLVDGRILDFIRSEKFSPGDFTVTNDGVCRLNPQLGRKVVGLLLHAPELKVSLPAAMQILNNFLRKDGNSGLKSWRE